MPNLQLEDEVEDEAATMAFRPSTKSRIHGAVCFVIAAGNLGFGLAASAAPSALAPIVREDEETVRAMGVHDIGAALALWGARDRRWPLALSLRHDLFEAIGWARSKPKIAAVPFLWAVLALVGLLTWEPRGKQ